MWLTIWQEYFLNHPARNDRFFTINFWLTVAINLLLWFFVFLLAQPVSHQIVLHYNIYFGIDLLDSWAWLLALPVAGIFIFFVNNLLAYWLYTKNLLLAQMLSLAGTVSQVTLFLGLILIFAINA
jgi:hypothetical protein